MPRFVALLRGVNVGKANRVPMADFRAMLAELGYTEVQTLLNSGNAVFHSTGRSPAKHARVISSALQQRPGLDVPVVVQSSSQLQAVVAECPSPPPPEEHSRFTVAFAQEARALQELVALTPMVEKSEFFHLGKRAAYLHCPGGILESKAARALLSKARRGVTTRNWATVLKLEALVAARGN